MSESSRLRVEPKVNENGSPAEGMQVAAAPSSRTDVLDQLDRILKSTAFNKSHRYSAFLKYCVQRALDGQSDSLKERTIGVDVFERRSDYDPGNDHVVRSAASEVRRRLAQYYQDCAEPGEIRIEVLPGSYAPQFSVACIPGPALGVSPAVAPEEAPARRAPSWRRTGVAAAIIAALAFLVPLAYRAWRAPTGFEWFWAPLLSAPRPMTIFIGPVGSESTESRSASRDDAAVTAGDFMKNNVVSFASAAMAARLSGFLQAQGRSSQVLSSATSKFDDLQRGPTVLLGGLNNAWTLRLTDALRFSFDRSDPQHMRIRDRQRPEQSWSFDLTAAYQKVTRDYALITRVMHPATEQMTLIVAGLGQWGTIGAVDFITNPVRLQRLKESAGNRPRDTNVQVVVAVDVVDGAIGPPKVMATYFW